MYRTPFAVSTCRDPRQSNSKAFIPTNVQINANNQYLINILPHPPHYHLGPFTGYP